MRLRGSLSARAIDIANRLPEASGIVAFHGHAVTSARLSVRDFVLRMSSPFDESRPPHSWRCSRPEWASARTTSGSSASPCIPTTRTRTGFRRERCDSAGRLQGFGQANGIPEFLLPQGQPLDDKSAGPRWKAVFDDCRCLDVDHCLPRSTQGMDLRRRVIPEMHLSQTRSGAAGCSWSCRRSRRSSASSGAAIAARSPNSPTAWRPPMRSPCRSTARRGRRSPRRRSGSRERSLQDFPNSG